MSESMKAKHRYCFKGCRVDISSEAQKSNMNAKREPEGFDRQLSRSPLPIQMHSMVWEAEHEKAVVNDCCSGEGLVKIRKAIIRGGWVCFRSPAAHTDIHNMFADAGSC